MFSVWFLLSRISCNHKLLTSPRYTRHSKQAEREWYKATFKQLVGGTELEDSQKQRFHISRSFSSDTCQGNRQNKNVELRPLIKARREKREVVSDWTKSVDQSKTKALVRDFQRVDKLLLPAQDWLRNFDVSGF